MITENGYSLPKSERLSSFGAIRRLFKEGRGGFIYPFRYIVYAEPAEQTDVAILFSTPKKFHKRANRRNLLRRRMREAYRLNRTILAEAGKGAAIEVALIYSTKEIHDYKTIENGVKRVLQNIAGNL
ncbi:MAG: ribonuclease P protein component [Alistipes sp.]|nr:ribonuclease P protein component [Alistipes sp.]